MIIFITVRRCCHLCRAAIAAESLTRASVQSGPERAAFIASPGSTHFSGDGSFGGGAFGWVACVDSQPSAILHR